MQAQASELPQQPTRRQYDCVCIKYGFGQLHKVSRVTWQRHYASASSEDERQRIYTARLLGDRVTSLPPLASPSSPSSRDYSVPPSIRRAEARRGLAKRAREDRDPNGYVGRRKRARVKQPIDINQIEDNSGVQESIQRDSDTDSNAASVNPLAALALAASKARDILPLPPLDPSQESLSSSNATASKASPILELEDAILPTATSTPPAILPMVDNSVAASVNKSTKVGGKAKMRPGPAKNGRNLCAHRWRKQVQSSGLTEEFQKYYNSLTSAQRVAYDNEAMALATSNTWDAKNICNGTLH